MMPSGRSGELAPRAVAPLARASRAEVELAGSKSEALRAITAAALSQVSVDVVGVSACDDVRHLVAALACMGWPIRFERPHDGVEAVRVQPRVSDAAPSADVDCGHGAAVLRFLISVAAVTPGTWVLRGSPRLSQRDCEPLIEAWRRAGTVIERIDPSGARLPLRVHGRAPREWSPARDTPARLRVDSSGSSQFLSSLLLAGLAFENGLHVDLEAPTASRGYVDLTLAVLGRLGCDVELGTLAARVSPSRTLQARAAAERELHVARDWSAMGVWSCLNALTGSRVHCTHLRPGSGQPDEGLGRVLAQLASRAPRELSVLDMPDQFLNVAVAAALRQGRTHLIGGRNLRGKESDRIAVAARELSRLGVRVREFDDGLDIEGAETLRAATIDPAGDHRVAMAFALAGLVSPGIAVADPGCVDKSYPAFWSDLERVQRDA